MAIERNSRQICKNPSHHTSQRTTTHNRHPTDTSATLHKEHKKYTLLDLKFIPLTVSGLRVTKSPSVGILREIIFQFSGPSQH